MMQTIQSLTEEIKTQVQMQIKDFSVLQQLEKQVQNMMKKEIVVASELNEASLLSSSILDVYFMLEEEYEMQIYKIDEVMQNESDLIALDFSLKVGNLAIGLINYCFKMSLKCQDIEQRFTKVQLEDLLIVNINYSRKLLDINQGKTNETLLQSTCSINSLIFNLLSDQLEHNENLQSLYFCNEYNLLEIQALNPKTSFSDILKHCNQIQKLFDSYPQLTSCKKNTIENMLCILFEQVADCQTKKVDEVLKMIQECPQLLEIAALNYRLHYLKLQLINSIDHKDIQLFEKLEKEYSLIHTNGQGDFFTLILNTRKLKINSEDKYIKKTMTCFEEYLIKNKAISNLELSQLLCEITYLDVKLFYLCFTVFQQYIIASKNVFIQDNKVQKTFYDAITILCTLVDEFFANKDAKKHLENILESFRDCIKQIIAIILSVKKLTIQDINNLQIFFQRVCKIILEVAINLKDLKDKPINNTIEIIEIFLILLKKQQKDNAQHQIFIDEVSCLGLLCSMKVNNQNSIKELSRNIQDSFCFLPQILMASIKKEEISISEFTKLLNSLLRQNNNSPQNSQNLINLFALKNLINQMDSYQALLEFYISFIDQNFEEYFCYFRRNFIENYLDRATEISICTPFIKKISSLKQNTAQNIATIQETINMLFTIIEKYYQYYSTVDKDVPLNVLITEKERKELIDLMHNYFSDADVSSDPRISCKFLHYIILYSCLDVVFDNQSSDYYEKTYLNQCIYKLNYKLTIKTNDDENQSQNQNSSLKLFKNPYFLRSLILLYSYQISFYELSVKSTSLPKNSLETLSNLIESYELTTLNLIDHLTETDHSLVKETLKNQFFLFQFIFSILQNNVTKSLSVIEIFLKYFPNQLVLLSQISKTKQKPDLIQIINKKYIYYLSSNNYQVEQFSQSLEESNSIESSYLPVKMIIEKVLTSDQLQSSQVEIIHLIIKELISKLKNINSHHHLIQELNNLQRRYNIN